MERIFMERLKYIVEDSTIAELLGVQNFTNKESAILELVKKMLTMLKQTMLASLFLIVALSLLMTVLV